MMEAGGSGNVEESTPLMGQNSTMGNDGLLPKPFTSVPALNESASYLSQTTNLTGCFSDYSVEYSDNSSRGTITDGQELRFASEENSNSAVGSFLSSSQHKPASYESCSTSTAAPPTQEELTGTTVQGPSNGASSLIVSNYTGQNGVSIFQSLIIRARRTVRGSADDIGWLQRDPEMPPVEDGTERFMEILDYIRSFQQPWTTLLIQR